MADLASDYCSDAQVQALLPKTLVVGTHYTLAEVDTAQTQAFGDLDAAAAQAGYATPLTVSGTFYSNTSVRGATSLATYGAAAYLLFLIKGTIEEANRRFQEWREKLKLVAANQLKLADPSDVPSQTTAVLVTRFPPRGVTGQEKF